MRRFETITKAELISALSNLADDDRIAFASDYGDRCHTQQVHALRGELQDAVIKESAYSDSGFAIEDAEDAEEHGVEADQKVWVLS